MQPFVAAEDVSYSKLTAGSYVLQKDGEEQNVPALVGPHVRTSQVVHDVAK